MARITKKQIEAAYDEAKAYATAKVQEAYGEDWKEVVAFFEKMGQCFDHKYLAGERSADKKVGQYYNPAMAEKLRAVKGIVEEFTPFVQAHKNMPLRAQTVSYRILNRYLEYVCGLSEVLILKSLGAGKEAKELFTKFLSDFGKYELEMERWYDQFNLGNAYYKRVLKKEGERVDYGVDA